MTPTAATPPAPVPLRVDGAVHVWSDDPVAHPWGPHDGHELPTVAGSVEALLATLDAHGTDAAVCVQPRVYGYDHGYLAEVVARHRSRVAAVGLVNPVRPGGPDELRRLVGDHGFSGVRLLPLAAERAPWLTGPEGDPLWDAAVDLGVPVSVLARPDQLDAVRARARRTPGATVVLDHLGLVTTPRGPGLDALLACAGEANVAVKVSALADLAHQGSPADTEAVAAAAVAAFGPDRVVFGTDWPYALEHGPWSRGADILSAALGDGADAPGLRGANAARLWALDPDRSGP